MPAEINVKGASFQSVLAALGALSGPEAEQRVRAALPPAVGTALSTGAMIASGWYPVAWYRDLYGTIASVTGGGASICRQLGRLSAERDVTTIYKFLFRLLSPATVMQSGQKALSQYFQGVTSSFEATPTGCIARYRGFHGFNEHLWADLVGGGERILELAGAKDVVAAVMRGGRDGDPEADVDVRWR